MKIRGHETCLNMPVIALTVFIIAGSFRIANSQENPINVSFDEALRMAFAEDPGLAARDDKIIIDEYKVKESVAQFNPRLDVYSSYFRTSLESDLEFVNPLSLGTQKISMYPEDRYNFGISLSHNFFTFGKRSAIKNAARLGVSVSELDRNEYKRYIYDKSARAFLTALLTGDNLSICKDNVSRALKKLDIVRSRMREGLASEYDSIRAELLIARYENDLNSAENAFFSARTSLKAILGLVDGEEIMPTGDLNAFEIAIPDSQEFDLDAVIDLLRLDKSIDIQNELIKYHKRSFYPTLTYSAKYDWQNGLQPDIDKITDYWTIGLSLNMNLFDGGLRKSRIGEARYEAMRARNLRSDLEPYIKANIRSSWVEIETSRDEIQIARKRLNLAEKGLAIAEARYNEGLLSVSDLLDLELEKGEAEIGLNLSLYKLLISRLNLKSAAGYYPELGNHFD